MCSELERRLQYFWLTLNVISKPLVQSGQNQGKQFERTQGQEMEDTGQTNVEFRFFEFTGYLNIFLIFHSIFYNIMSL